MYKIDNVSDWILYEDNHLMAINKPGGILTQGDQTGDPSARDHLISFIKHRDNKPGKVYMNPAHRLDRTVSGVLLFSKTSKAIARLHQLFREREVTKIYWALCEPNTNWNRQEFVVEGYIRKNRAQGRVSFKPKPFPEGKHSKTFGKWLFKNDHYGFELAPQSGRSHQLRVHMHSLGMPIVSDVRYGASQRHQGFIHLHARKLSFVHPVKKEPITIEAPLPSAGQWKQYQKSFGQG